MKDVSSLPSMRSRINSSQFERSEYPVWHEGGRGRRPGLITALIGGAPTGRMTARPWKNRKIKKLFAVNGSCLAVCKSLRSQPHCVRNANWPRYFGQRPWVRHGYATGVLLVNGHSSKERSVFIAAETTTRISGLNSQEGISLDKPNLCIIVKLALVSARSK